MSNKLEIVKFFPIFIEKNQSRQQLQEYKLDLYPLKVINGFNNFQPEEVEEHNNVQRISREDLIIKSFLMPIISKIIKLIKAGKNKEGIRWVKD